MSISKYDLLKQDYEELRQALAQRDKTWEGVVEDVQTKHKKETNNRQERYEAEVQKWKQRALGAERKLALYESGKAGKNQPDSFAGDDLTPDKKKKESKGKKGAKKKRKGHGKGGRKKEDQIPKTTETIHVPPKQCEHCRTDMIKVRDLKPRTSEFVEAIVTATVREIVLEQGVMECPECNSQALAGATLPIELSMGKYSIKTIVQQLIDHICHQIPVGRLADRLKGHGIEHISDGTLCDRFQAIAEELKDLDKAFIEESQRADHFEIDCSGLPVRGDYEEREGTESNHWPLWQILTANVTVFMLTTRQYTNNLLPYFSDILDRIKETGPPRILADRAPNIRALEKLGFLIAFCWAHTRRDFIKLCRSDSTNIPFATPWVEGIKAGFRLHRIRQKSPPQTNQWKLADAELRTHIQIMRDRLTKDLQTAKLTADQRSILKSLDDHWPGLTLFLDHIDLPMDNNAVERNYRWLALFRRCSYACQNEDRAQDRARFYTIFKTLKMHGINTERYLRAFLAEKESCKRNNENMPLTEWLPWALSEHVKELIDHSVTDQVGEPEAA